MAHGDEHAVGRHGARRTAVQRQKARAGHAGLIAQDLIHRVVPDERDLARGLERKQPILQYLLGAQLVAAMHQRDMRGDVGEIEGLLHRRITAAHHDDPLAPIEKAIAGGAGRDALAAEGLLGREPQVLGGGTGRDDQGLAGVLAVVSHEPQRPLAEVHAVDVVEHHVRIEALGMPAHAVHELRPLQVLDVARPVIDIGGGHELATLLESGDQERFAIGARRIHGRGISGRS